MEGLIVTKVFKNPKSSHRIQNPDYLCRFDEKANLLSCAVYSAKVPSTRKRSWAKGIGYLLQRYKCDLSDLQF